MLFSESEVILSVKCADYIGFVDADSHVNILALATVKETNQRFISCEAIWIEKPHIELKVCYITFIGIKIENVKV